MPEITERNEVLLNLSKYILLHDLFNDGIWQSRYNCRKQKNYH